MTIDIKVALIAFIMGLFVLVACGLPAYADTYTGGGFFGEPNYGGK